MGVRLRHAKYVGKNPPFLTVEGENARKKMAFVTRNAPQDPRLRPGPSGLPRGQVTEIQRSRMLAAARRRGRGGRLRADDGRAGDRPGEGLAQDLLRRVRRPRGLLPGGVRAGARRRPARSCEEAYEQRDRLARGSPRRPGEPAGVHGRGAGAGAGCASSRRSARERVLERRARGARGAGRGRRPGRLAHERRARPAGGDRRRRRRRRLRRAAHARCSRSGDEPLASCSAR